MKANRKSSSGQQRALAHKAQSLLCRRVRKSGKRKARHPRSNGDNQGAPAAEVKLGDAFDLATELAPKSVDLIITSPPYWGLRTYGLTHNWDTLADWKATDHRPGEMPPYEWYRDKGGLLGLEPIPDWYAMHLVEIFGRLGPALKPEGNVWVNLGDTYFARWSSIRDKGRQGLGDNPRIRRRMPMGKYRQEKQLLMIPARFAMKMQDAKWILRNDMIWFKPNVPPRPERDRLRLAHEHFFHFVLKPKEGRAKYYYDASKTEPGRTDVVTCNVVPGINGHSATFPEELVLPRILSSCPPDGVVLDPFCGSGTALCVALATGRKAIGFEVADEYYESSLQAIRAFSKERAQQDK